MPAGLIFLLVVLGLAAASVAMFRTGAGTRRAQRDFERRSLTTTGTVVALDQSQINTPGRGSLRTVTVFHPVLEFTGPDGQPRRAATITGSKPAPAQVGDVRQIMVDPAAPDRIELVGHSMRGALPALQLVMGVVFAGFAVLAALVGLLLIVVLDLPI